MIKQKFIERKWLLAMAAVGLVGAWLFITHIQDLILAHVIIASCVLIDFCRKERTTKPNTKLIFIIAGLAIAASWALSFTLWEMVFVHVLTILGIAHDLSTRKNPQT